MDVEFSKRDLDRLETDQAFTAGFSAPIVSLFRRRMQLIRAAADERAFYQLRSLHFEKLKGNRSHQYSMRLNRQWRLVLELKRTDEGKIVVVIDIEDYH